MNKRKHDINCSKTNKRLWKYWIKQINKFNDYNQAVLQFEKQTTLKTVSIQIHHKEVA